MTAAFLTRRSETPRPALQFHEQVSLTTGRAHEICGPARWTLALWLAAATSGPVLWIAPAWRPDQLHGDGVADTLCPGRLLFVRPGRAKDLLWCMEESLRSGAVPLVICELPEPPPLTPVRRLHLAADQGGQMGKPPLGLILTPGDGGAAGVETRWHMTAAHKSGQPGWQLERRRARTLPPCAWIATRPDGTVRLHHAPLSEAARP